MTNQLFYGDNLAILREDIKDESVDLCYIDPPFNSQRNYQQIYNNLGKKDVAQAFIDTWKWDDHANQGLAEISANYQGKFTKQSITLILGLTEILGKGSLLAYLISMTLRIVEIQRVLKPTGSFYLHCDPTASHYLKLVLDAVFCTQGGNFLNEIIWCYKDPSGKAIDYFRKKHDVIFFYTKSKQHIFNADSIRVEYGESTQQQIRNKTTSFGKVVTGHPLGKIPEDWWTIPIINSQAKERLGYPTQKPETLLERIILASSNENDVILDAYCGGGTTVAVAQKLNRQWIGIDITYQSISLILKRLEDNFGQDILDLIELKGIPKDVESATALAHKKDDRTRKEFEKWAILTYTNNRATINTKKGADQGIDGIVYFQSDYSDKEKIIIQVKSGNIKSEAIEDLQATMTLEQAELGVFITLKEPTNDMIVTAKKARIYQNKYMSQACDKITIVTIREIIEDKKRLEVR